MEYLMNQINKKKIGKLLYLHHSYFMKPFFNIACVQQQTLTPTHTHKKYIN